MIDSALAALLVEDSPHVAAALEQMLETRGRFRLVRVGRMGAIGDALAADRFDVMLLDLSLPDSEGLATVERAKELAPDLPIVVLTSTDDDAVGTGAVRRGAEDYLVKDRIDEGTVFRAAQHAIERRRLHRQRDDLVAELSAALERVRQLSGLLPICAHCKRIRDGEGSWAQLEVYIRDHSEAEFSHGICPQCANEVLADIQPEGS